MNPGPSDPKTKFGEGFPINEPILLLTTLTCTTPFPIIIKSIDLDTSNAFKCETDKRVAVSENLHIKMPTTKLSQNNQVIRKLVLESRDAYSFDHTIIPSPSTGLFETSPGTLTITCER